jgi:hypothetical protein
VLNPSGKFCPICKNKNPRTATVCKYCGALLDEAATNIVAPTENVSGQPKVSTENAESFVDMALIPKGGIAVYAAGTFKPYYLSFDAELFIGRKQETSSEEILDLSDLDAFNQGISRRHAKIRRAETGFEIIDLSSTNGTWLNAERLIPNKPYPLASGSQLRLGRIRLFVLYSTILKGTQKK